MAGFDYSWEGAYFVTICTQHREQFLGQIYNEKMWLNECGRIVSSVWHDLPNHFPNVRLDQFAVMPNHVHGILWITDPVGAQFIAPQISGPSSPVDSILPRRGVINHAPTLGVVVRYWKAQSTYAIHQRDSSLPVWQRNYHERIIRNDEELNRIRQYIQDNPKNWDQDPENTSVP